MLLLYIVKNCKSPASSTSAMHVVSLLFSVVNKFSSVAFPQMTHFPNTWLLLNSRGRTKPFRGFFFISGRAAENVSWLWILILVTSLFNCGLFKEACLLIYSINIVNSLSVKHYTKMKIIVRHWQILKSLVQFVQLLNFLMSFKMPFKFFDIQWSY